MSLLTVAARILTGLPYVQLGYGAAASPGPRIGMAAPLLRQVRSVVPIPVDDETVVRINGGLQAAAGAAVVLGVYPRPASLALAGSLIPTTLAGHDFWNQDDPAQRAQMQTQFLKNVAMVGGVLAVAAMSKK